jgi:hypothetical protein
VCHCWLAQQCSGQRSTIHFETFFTIEQRRVESNSSASLFRGAALLDKPAVARRNALLVIIPDSRNVPAANGAVSLRQSDSRAGKRTPLRSKSAPKPARSESTLDRQRICYDGDPRRNRAFPHLSFDLTHDSRLARRHPR